ncbi:hypothetical protein ACXET9_15535 [Brachybacterium sp. DNPG3]
MRSPSSHRKTARPLRIGAVPGAGPSTRGRGTASRITAISVVPVVLALLLSGCAAEESPIPGDEIEGHYEEVLGDIAAALDGAGYTTEPASGVSYFYEHDGVCRYQAIGLLSRDLDDALTAEDDWDDSLAALAPVLEEHGFAALDGPRRTGAVRVAEATDGAGATLSIDEYGEIGIRGALTDASACTEE